jgi:hypothetical protein
MWAMPVKERGAGPSVTDWLVNYVDKPTASRHDLTFVSLEPSCERDEARER